MISEFDKILQKYFKSLVGELIVTDAQWNILYKTGTVDIDEEHWNKWCKRYLDDSTEGLEVEWEVADKETDTYYRVFSKEIAEKGEKYLVHQITDVSDYAVIFKNLSAYSRSWRTLSTCQSDLMNVLTDKLTGCLPIVVKNLQAECAVLFINRAGSLKSYICKLGSDKASKRVFTGENFDTDYESGKSYSIVGLQGELLCFASGTAADDTYGLFVKVPQDDFGDKMYPLYFNIFKLYIENALLREKIIYESEHDHLTGLYNKQKYSELLRTRFMECHHISILNLDVNYLKRVNDTLGHQAGNRLLCMAAESLQAVEDVDIYAFRLGGDEFMLIACDADEEKAKQIEMNWREALQEINDKEEAIECVIACGRVTGVAPYSLPDLLDESDKLMYTDKRAIKISRGDDPDAR